MRCTPLQHFHQQLRPPHSPDVARHLRAIHPLFARSEPKGRYLGIGHLLKGLIQQIAARFLHVSAQAFAEVVQRAQVEVAFSQLAIAQRIAHLHVVAEGVIHLFVRPPMACFQIL